MKFFRCLKEKGIFSSLNPAKKNKVYWLGEIAEISAATAIIAVNCSSSMIMAIKKK